MQAELLSETWKGHKSLTSSYVLMLSMGIENAQNIFLLWYFQHFEENLSIILFFLNSLFQVWRHSCGFGYTAQDRKWTLIKRHMFVGGFQYCYLSQVWITISIFFIFQCLVYKGLCRTYSQHSYYHSQCLSTSTYTIWALHPIDKKASWFHWQELQVQP